LRRGKEETEEKMSEAVPDLNVISGISFDEVLIEGDEMKLL